MSNSCDPMDWSRQAPLSMGFSRQEYWSGLPFPSPGDLPNPGIEPRSPALQADSLQSEPPGKPLNQQWKQLSPVGKVISFIHSKNVCLAQNLSSYCEHRSSRRHHLPWKLIEQVLGGLHDHFPPSVGPYSCLLENIYPASRAASVRGIRFVARRRQQRLWCWGELGQAALVQLAPLGLT